MDSFETLVAAVKAASEDQKQRIFREIRDSILVHDLERVFNVRAEVILEAISRASDLTQRGVRGVIAETVFALEVIPTAVGWDDVPPEGDLSYDARVVKDTCGVRIQVKMQRKTAGQPMTRRDGRYVVEVQRTRGGMRDGVSTRPYRFGEFDLLAVCMEPSTKDWKSFVYAPAASLEPDARDKRVIKTFQSVPAYDSKEPSIWTSDLLNALDDIKNENGGEKTA